MISKSNMILILQQILVMLILAPGALFGQQVLSASSGNSSGNSGSTTFVVGQIFYQGSSGSGGSAIEGVLQPISVSVISGLENIDEMGISLYPNPTDQIINLKSGRSDHKGLSYSLFDFQGRVIRSGEITSANTAIDLSDIPASAYFIRIFNEQKLIASYKIVKR
jgi:hypothetical protein